MWIGERLILLRGRKRMLLMPLFRSLPAWVVGEFAGTFLLVFFGCGSVCAAVATGAPMGVFQVAFVWGLGIAIAIYVSAALSGAHLNPAVTISMAVWGGFPARRVPGYLATQMLAAFAAAAVLYLIFGGAITEFESKNNIVRGQKGSEASAMVFGEFYPNPGGKPLPASSTDRPPAWRAFATEAIGTAVLLLVIFCVTDANNRDRPQILTAPIIGLTITLLISLLSPITMAGFNPARDLGPRLFSSLAGWKTIPFSVNGSGWFTVYVLAPIIGGQAGGAIYRLFFRRNYRTHHHAILTEEAGPA